VGVASFNNIHIYIYNNNNNIIKPIIITFERFDLSKEIAMDWILGTIGFYYNSQDRELLTFEK
jgi:hypothetical protein